MRRGRGWPIGLLVAALMMGTGCRPSPSPVRAPEERRPVAPAAPSQPRVEGIASTPGGTCVLQGGQVRCWGERGRRCGSSDEQAVADLPPVRAIFAGGWRTCAIGQAGGAWCWEPEGRPVPLTPHPAQARDRVNLAEAVAIVPTMHDEVCVADRLGVVGAWELDGGTYVPADLPRKAPMRVTGLAPDGDGWKCIGVADGRLHDLQYGWKQPTALPPVAQVAYEDDSACAVDLDGRVHCWQVHPRRDSPVELLALPPVAQIAAGETHSCARTRDGELWCWGRGDNGQLGLGVEVMNREERSGPQRVPGLAGVRLVSAAGKHTCAVVGDADVYCWGDNERGQLGLGEFARAPRRWPEGHVFGKVDRVIAGAGTCIVAEGTLRCAGPIHSQPRSRFEALPGVTGVTAAAAGPYGVCAAVAGDRVACWHEREQEAPAPFVVPAAGRAVDLAVAELRACAVGHDGKLRCWGLDVGHSVYRAPPKRRLEAIEAGEIRGPHHCGDRADGRPGCWNFGLMRWFRDLLPPPHSEGAALVIPGISEATAVALGNVQTCVLRRDGGVWCEGPDGPRRVLAAALQGRAVRSIAAPGRGICVLDTGGAVACQDFAVPPGLPRLAELVAGSEHLCGRGEAGEVVCWGGNEAAQLGEGSCAPQNGAVRVALPGPARSLAAGRSHSCAVLQDGALWCWGEGRDGAAHEEAPRRVASPALRGGPPAADAMPAFTWAPLAADDGFEATIEATLRERFGRDVSRDCFALEWASGRCDARAELDGDGLVDRVVTVRRKVGRRSQLGLAILWGNGEAELLGAGRALRGLSVYDHSREDDEPPTDVTRDLAWIEAWDVFAPTSEGFTVDRELNLIEVQGKVPPLPQALGDVLVMTDGDAIVALYRVIGGWGAVQAELQPR
ncbi:RCC1 domain-containing protein [Nannocystis radixulma]|uniref:Regulator of chromosome condensation (RCC1) repeat-containing protein n=1 Tax=Nannocystis radixulma TaxID=2995305 RepID=A0ABT5BEM8_9BACT|nr:hypothetical protein [Nannocystis radixulma]MDC0672522.1 hypothetical protein [Nannocystis radixulma]